VVDRTGSTRTGSTPGDVGAVRAGNLSRVVRSVLAAEAPPTRAEVAAATSMTRATVSRLTDDLLAGGILAELDPVSGGPGRPGTPLVAGARRYAALGLQVNVSYLAAVVVDLRGTLLVELVEPGDQRDLPPEQVLGRLAALAAKALADIPSGMTLVGSRVAVPGIVSSDSGVLLRAPNLGWSGVEVSALLDLSGAGAPPASVGNEAELASASVSLERPGRPGPLRDFVYLSGEIGIGGAVVLDGRPVLGRHGWAGEIGHVTVDPAGPACACGSTGCLEQYAGRRALFEAAGLAPTSATADLVRLVGRGDPDAVAAVDRAAWGLGTALAVVVNLVDVPVIVLGGHLRELAGLLQPRVEAILRSRVLSAAWDSPRVLAADAHPAPGALGGALLELEQLVADPAGWLTR